MAKISISVHMFTCKTCHQPYNNRLKHVCVMRWEDMSKPAPMRNKKKR